MLACLYGHWVIYWVGGMNIIPGPIWINHCNHPIDSYVGSFQQVETQEIVQYDLYLYRAKYEGRGQHVCIRFGDGPEEYWSPYDVLSVLSAKLPSYEGAAEVLKQLGTFEWKRKEEGREQESQQG